MISVNNLTIAFGGYTLLDSITFLINKRDRVGLTGRNGAGKSTLLKTLAGLQSPPSGTINAPSDLKIGYLPQTKAYAQGKTVRDEATTAFNDILHLQARLDDIRHQLATRDDYHTPEYLRLIDQLNNITDQLHLRGADDIPAQVETILKGLGFRQHDLDRPCEEFSGGWRMRVELAKVLLARPNLLLLDEPTNHLDIESITWLEAFLQSYPGALILVSHDRAFLDNVTTRTLEISLGKIYDYNVPYTRYTQLRRERIEQQTRAYENQQKQIKDTEQFIERFRYKATKATQVQSRVKQLERLQRVEIEPEDTARVTIRFQPAPRSGDIVLTARDLTLAYGPRVILRDINLQILRGEKIALVGRNGEGKTTLLRAIMNQIPHDGTLRLGHNVRVGYFAQNQADLLDPALTVLDTVDRVAVGDIRQRLRDILGAFLFSGEDIDKKVQVLSGGERSRLAMIRLLLEPYNLLILDEPTNHLDLRTKDILKAALQQYDGTLLLVSHDRDFLNGLAQKVHECANQGLKEYLGGIPQFLREKQITTFREYEQTPATSPSTPAPSSSPSIFPSDSKLAFQQRKQLGRDIRRAQREVQQIEDEITRLETLLADDEALLAAGNADPDLLARYADTRQSLDQALARWEQASTTLEQIQNNQ